MQICQNPRCHHHFNPDGNEFCSYCGSSNLGELFRNRFRVLAVLGEGGFGKTYQAEDADRLDDPCVIKQFVPQVQGTAALTKAAELFKQEAKRLYELGEHHQIPRLISYFEQGNRLYLVQEYIKGETLARELQRGRFSEDKVWQILTDLLPVLQFIHQKNIIHRDIKPDNIIRRQDGKLVLIDFGGAKQVTQTSLARAGTGIFTPGYAPTEQMAGKACHASDLYSLGVTCTRLLTGCLPIADDYGDIEDAIYDAMAGRWLWREFLSKNGITFSNKLGEVLDKLLAHLPKDRYQSAAEVLQAMNAPVLGSTSIYNIVFGKKPNTPQPPLKQLQVFDFDVVTLDSQGKIKSKQRLQAEYLPENLGNGIFLEMVSIPGGTFLMGSPDKEGNDRERPQHRVTVAPFLMGKFPVTQAQWKAVAALPPIKIVLKSEPSRFKDINRPVESIS